MSKFGEIDFYILKLGVMKKCIVLLCLAFFLVSCGNKETLQNKIEIQDNYPQKENVNQADASDKLSYKIEEEDGNKNLYLLKNGKKIKVDSAFDYATIYNIELYGDFLVYDWASTGGTIKKIFDTSKMEEVSKINFGTWDNAKKIIYSCQEGGYGPGYVQIFNFKTRTSKDLFKDFYEKNYDAGVLSCNFDENALQIYFIVDDNGEKSYNYDISADILKQLEK